MSHSFIGERHGSSPRSRRKSLACAFALTLLCLKERRIGGPAARRPQDSPCPGGRAARGRRDRHLLERAASGVLDRRQLRVSPGQQPALSHRDRSGRHCAGPDARQRDPQGDPVRAGRRRATGALERPQSHPVRGVHRQRRRGRAADEPIRAVHRGVVRETTVADLADRARAIFSGTDRESRPARRAAAPNLLQYPSPECAGGGGPVRVAAARSVLRLRRAGRDADPRRLRQIKTPYEQEVLRRASTISSEAHRAGMRAAAPASSNTKSKPRSRLSISQRRHELGVSLDRRQRPERHDPPLQEVSRQMEPGDLLWSMRPPIIRATGDITRTYPIDGTFAPSSATSTRSCLRRRRQGAAAKAGDAARTFRRRATTCCAPGWCGLAWSPIQPASNSRSGRRTASRTGSAWTCTTSASPPARRRDGVHDRARDLHP